MVIWKWFIALTEQQTLGIPGGAKFLDVQMQAGVCCIWALCDPTALPAPRRIAMYGTGKPVPDNHGAYIATFQTLGGGLVFHVFESPRDGEQTNGHD